jgi:hypothetical protein
MSRQDYAPRDTFHRMSAWNVAGTIFLAFGAIALPAYVLFHLILWAIK